MRSVRRPARPAASTSWPASQPAPSPSPARLRRPGDDALIVYTSGTTGKPKGAVHTHASLLAGVSALLTAWDWEPEDRLVLCLPLFHVHGLCAGLFGTLAAGASAVVFDRFDEAAVLGAAPAEHHVLRRADHVPPPRRVGTGACSSARCACACRARRRWRADLWHQLAGDGVEVLERYGMTETLLTLSNPLAGERRPGSVGVPLPGVEAARRATPTSTASGSCSCAARRCAAATGAADDFAAGELVRHRRPGVGVPTTATSPSAGAAPS